MCPLPIPINLPYELLYCLSSSREVQFKDYQCYLGKCFTVILSFSVIGKKHSHKYIQVEQWRNTSGAMSFAGVLLTKLFSYNSQMSLLLLLPLIAGISYPVGRIWLNYSLCRLRLAKVGLLRAYRIICSTQNFLYYYTTGFEQAQKMRLETLLNAFSMFVFSWFQLSRLLLDKAMLIITWPSAVLMLVGSLQHITLLLAFSLKHQLIIL